MKLTEQQQGAQEVKRNIISKCWEDENFKARLVSDPIATLESFTGKTVNVPEGKKLVVADQSSDPNTIYLTIPAKPDLENLELTDEQLEMVAGGGFFGDLGDAIDSWLYHEFGICPD